MIPSLNWYEDLRLVNWDPKKNDIPYIGISNNSSVRIFNTQEELLKNKEYKQASLAQIAQIAVMAFKSASIENQKRIPNLLLKIIQLSPRYQAESGLVNFVFSLVIPSTTNVKKNEQDIALKIYNQLTVDALKDAVRKGDLVWLKDILSKDKSHHFLSKDKSNPSILYTKDEQGNTLLHLAARFGHTEIVKYLIELDSVLYYYKNNDYKTALQLAYEISHKEIVETLYKKIPFEFLYNIISTLQNLNNEKDIDYEKCIYGCRILRESLNSPLSKVLVDGFFKILINIQKMRFGRDLITHEFNELCNNITDSNQWLFDTCILWLKNKELQLAVVEKNITKIKEIVPTLKSVSESSDTWAAQNFDNYDTVLHLAARANQEEICLILLSSPVCRKYLKLKNHQGHLPVHIAAMQGNLKLFNRLLNEVLKSDYLEELSIKSPILADIEGRTPLHLAAQEGQLDICRFLLNPLYKDCISISDRFGRTALYPATQKGHFKIVVLLLKELFKDCDQNILSEPRNTPGGIWDKLDDKLGVTLLHLAAQNGNEELCTLFTTHPFAKRMARFLDINSISPLHSAAMNGNIKIFKMIYQANQSAISLVNNSNQTCLHSAVATQHVDMCALICELEGKSKEKNESLLKQDVDGQTPLHLAAKAGNQQITQILINHDSQNLLGSFRDKDGKSARQLSASHKDVHNLLKKYCPTKLDAERAFSVLEISFVGIIQKVNEKVPQEDLLMNLIVSKPKFQLIIEALSEDPEYEPLIKPLIGLYNNCCEILQKLETKKSLIANELPLIEEMTKWLINAKSILTPKVSSTPSSVSPPPPTYVVDNGPSALKIDLAARDFYYKYPKLLTHLDSALKKTLDGKFSQKIKGLMEELSDEVISQPSILTLILLNILSSYEEIDKKTIPEIFLNDKTLEKIKSLKLLYNSMVKKPEDLSSVAEYIINTSNVQGDLKISESNEKEFQEFSKICLSIVGSPTLTQTEFGVISRCYLQIYMFPFSDYPRAIQLNVDNDTFFQAELIYIQMPNQDPRKKRSAMCILNGYSLNEQWRWAELFLDHNVPHQSYSDALVCYFLQRFFFENLERGFGLNTNVSKLKEYWKKILENGLTEQVSQHIISKDDATVEFFYSITSEP